ncbi:uncharacterized protein M6B38_207985 [Iris pallida]|uniref:Uncharacterized protein n=1 Tax=Iris pallida TaxID=29817 RepID=A0AAX6E5F8_IRIPA|nr:uncharacterized protein M6B38_207985 [Iris pallida]
MNILSWMQTKLDRRVLQEKLQKPTSSSPSAQCRPPPPSRKEEFSDWPEILLAIGTLGNKKANEEAPVPERDGPPPQAGDIGIDEATEKATADDQTLSMASEADQGPGDDHDDEVVIVEASPGAETVLNKAKDLLADKKGGIRERSLPFLLKKMFVCHGGFGPTPSLKDPLTESRADKIMRTLPHKKIHPQSTLQPLAKRMLTKKLLGRRREEILWSEEEAAAKAKTERGDDRNKWVKTDSEYFVLEIERTMPLQYS